MIDFARGDEYPSSRDRRASAGLDRAGTRQRSGIELEPTLGEPNGAQRQRAMIEGGRLDARDVRKCRARDARHLFRGGSSMSSGPGEPSEAELRAAWEEQLRQRHAGRRDRADGRVADQPGRPAAGSGTRDRGRARPRAGARRDRRRARPAAGARAARGRAASSRRCARRSRRCSSNTRSWPAAPRRRGAPAPAPAPEAGAGARPQARPARSRASRTSRDRVRRSAAAGCGCPGS